MIVTIFKKFLQFALNHKKAVFAFFLFILLFNIIKMFFGSDSVFNNDERPPASRKELGIITVKTETVEEIIYMVGEISFKENQIY